jgi:hypothetical protein
MRLLSISRLLIAICILAAPAATNSATDEQPLTATPELNSQKYCPGDAELFSVSLSLRMKYENHTGQKLILDKLIGKAWYGVTVAHSKEDLAAGKYEYHPNIDWFFSEKDKLLKKPSADLPGSDFVILAPDQIFESEIATGVFVQYENARNVAGSIRSGVHVLQMELSAWNHPGEASEFERSWRQYGHLVTGVIKTGPLEIRVPPNPKVEKKCK